MKIFTLFLSTFENEYIDDQLAHVLNIRKAAIQKEFYRVLDFYSDKISKCEYIDIKDYENDVLDVLIRKTDCMGGLFATIYDDDCIIKLKYQSVNYLQINQYYKKYFNEFDFISDPRIVTDPKFVFNYVLEIPIYIVELKGIICLFDDKPHKFNYFKNMLAEIEAIKLDNDLNNLANLLRLEPRETAFIKPLNQLHCSDHS